MNKTLKAGARPRATHRFEANHSAAKLTNIINEYTLNEYARSYYSSWLCQFDGGTIFLLESRVIRRQFDASATRPNLTRRASRGAGDGNFTSVHRGDALPAISRRT